MIKSNVILQIDLIEEFEMYQWLKTLMQNPIYEDESLTEQMFREKLFTALNVIDLKKQTVRSTFNEEKANKFHELFEDDEIPF